MILRFDLNSYFEFLIELLSFEIIIKSFGRGGLLFWEGFFVLSNKWMEFPTHSPSH